ncbi:hypothetical protein CNR22_14115 [Sphingobacteriaceae bacterium]|nr:hypothetical protein CNR22_14115 [Sphingobacteriaceae bacterium]
MIYRLIDLPSNVIGFKALWDLTEKDFEEVMLPSVENHVGKTGKLNCLILLNSSVQHFRLSLLSGLKHLMQWKSHWRRVAIVSESKSAKLFVTLLSYLFATEVTIFSIDDMDKAIAWAAEESA